MQNPAYYGLNRKERNMLGRFYSKYPLLFDWERLEFERLKDKSLNKWNEYLKCH